MGKSFNQNLKRLEADTIHSTEIVGEFPMYDGESINIFNNGKTYSFSHYCESNGQIYVSDSYTRNDVLNAIVRYLTALTSPSKLK